ncbi:MAG: hypothetical protein ACRDOH_20465 [Streptosporangiaceae bacterium]
MPVSWDGNGVATRLPVEAAVAALDLGAEWIGKGNREVRVRNPAPEGITFARASLRTWP